MFKVEEKRLIFSQRKHRACLVSDCLITTTTTPPPTITWGWATRKCVFTSKLIHNIHALLDNGSNFQNNEHAERVMKCFQKSYIYLFLRCWLLTMIFIWYKIIFICSSHALVCNWNNFSENLCSNFLNMIIRVFSQKLKGEEYAIWQIDSISIIV